MNASAIAQRLASSESAKRSVVKLLMFGMATALFSHGIPRSVSAQWIDNRITLGNTVEPDPLILKGMSGGEVKATEIVKTEETVTGFCNGFVDSKPNHVLVLSNFFDFLKIEIDSQTDTTIVVEGPGGVWCNDDSVDANPAIEGEWQPGKYKIWIGSYQEDTNNSYLIKITDKN